MTDLFDRACRIALAVIVSTFALAACGPGSGGTGTGAAIGFSGSQVTGGAGVPGGSPGVSHTVVFELRIAQPSVQLVQCGTAVFAGTALVTSTDVSVAGQYDDGHVQTPTVLHLQLDTALPDASAVTMTLTDSAGRVLLGPVTLSRTGANGAAGTCS